VPSLSRRKHAPKGPIKPRDPTGAVNPMGAQRCHARSKTTGQQCKQAVVPGATVCHYHGGAAPQVQNAARERLRALIYPALTAYEELLEQKEFPTVRFAAAREVVNHEFGKPGGEDVNVNVNVTVEAEVLARLERGRQRNANGNGQHSE
jgi:hypothetical protein